MLSKLCTISTLVLVLLFATTESAEARRGGFISFGGEKITKIADLPDTEDYQLESGEYVDVGYMYKQVSIVFIPVWNYDLQWCGYIDDETYMDATKEDLDAMAEAAGVTIPDASLPFWDSIGGKLVLVLLVGAFIAYSVFSSDDDEEEATTTTTEEKPAE